MNKYLKKTKIIATLGPASSSKEVMLDLMKAGVDIFRINFSHADYDLVRKNIEIIRELNSEYGYSVGILGDLQGPKLRVGVVKEGSYLNPGDILTFTNAILRAGVASKLCKTNADCWKIVSQDGLTMQQLKARAADAAKVHRVNPR
jgi:pyruvate kinase